MAHILIAEDEDSVRGFVSRALAHKGHTILAVADGGSALDALAEEKLDLILADIVMPVMDGIALAPKTSTMYPELPVVLMTGYPSERHRALNLESLIAEVISKPFSLDEITAAVDNVLAG